MKKLIICEDEPITAKLLANDCQDLGYTVLEILYGKEEVEKIIEEKNPDILLMDINLAGRSGLDIATSIKHLKIPIIFITSHTDDHKLSEAAKLHAAGYIVKPASIDQLKAQLSLAEKLAMNRELIRMETKRGVIQLSFEEISHLESQKNYTVFHLNNGDQIRVRGTLKSFYDLLPEDLFIPVHRSFIVNRNYVQIIDGKLLKMRVGAFVTVGRKHLEEVKKLLS